MSRHDLVVIGGGTAGLTAAVGAAAVGARVLLAEQHRTGGDCLCTGCVPSKALIATARRAHAMRTADAVGLDPVEPVVDLARVMQRVHDTIATIEPHDSPDRLRREGVEVVEARAEFVGPGRVSVGGRVVETRSVLVATGSHPVLPPVDGLAEARPLTTETLWDLRELPRRLVVLGGGAIGSELGQAFARLGSQVTIVELADRLLPTATPEVGEILARAFADEGIEVRVASRAVKVGEDEVVVDGPGGRDAIGFDRLLVAAGRRPRTTGLGLDRVGVETTASGHVLVDDTLRTTAPHVFAAGDVTGLMPFTHVAGAHAGLVVTNALFGLRRTLDHTRVPWAVFTDPEVAHVGVTPEQARARWGDEAIVVRFDHATLDRAITDGDTRGGAIVVADPKQRLVGGTLVGEAAGESIAELVAWIHAGATLRQVGEAVHAYPTMSMAPWQAAREHLRERFLSPTVRRASRPVLFTLRHLSRPRP